MGILPMGSPFLMTLCWPLVYSMSTVMGAE